MARPPAPKRQRPPLRDGVGAGGQGQGRPSGPSSAGVTMPVVADVYSHLADGEHPEPEEELEIEDDDDIGEDARGLFDIDLGDGIDLMRQHCTKQLILIIIFI